MTIKSESKVIDLVQADTPSAIPLRSNLAQPALQESSAFLSRIRQDLFTAESQVSMIDGELQSLLARKDDLNKIVSACRKIEIDLEGGE